MEYLYITIFLLSLPLVWNILYSLRFEGLFKAGHLWQIKTAYILVTIICSHLIASAINTFVNSIYSLF